MPRFATPEPITAQVEATAGSVRLIATERDDTVVEVRPRDETRAADVRAAEQARVHYASGKLAVASGKWGLLGGRTGAVDIVVELPSQSRLHAQVASGDVHADGEFTACRFASASGELIVASVSGAAKVATASGNATIERLDGDMDFSAASGALSIGHLRGNLKAQTASGSVSVATATSGAVVVRTSSGDVAVGIPEGTAGHLDVVTGSGVVSNRLHPSDGPAAGEDTLTVEVRSGSGDVDIHRAVVTRGTISG
jgi:DUF4097 and DUF4098 domain-containing protein YvlB